MTAGRIAGWLELSKANYDARLLRSKLTLTGNVSEMSAAAEAVTLRLYEETDTHIYVPRQAGFLTPDAIRDATDCTTMGEPRDFGPAFALRPYQGPAVNDFMAALSSYSPYGGILEAPAGSGKTVMMLEIVRRLARTTVIIVHKEFLVNQWEERIRQYLPNARIGRVRQDRCDFGDRFDVVIALVQSLSARRYPDAFYAWPGVVLSDETHRLGAETWAPVIPKFAARWRVAGTATARRKDGMEPAFFWHIGPIIARVSRLDSKVMPGVVKQLWFDERYPLGRYMLRNGKFNLSKWITDLADHPRRNAILLSYFKQSLERGRKVLALTDRLAHISVMSDMLYTECPGVTLGRYIGQKGSNVKKNGVALALAAQARVIFGTYAMAAEGLDIPELDTLILMTPKGDVEQAVGRIQRLLPNKKTPIVIDIVDRAVGMAEGLAGSRRQVYARLNFKVV